jgi:hypothetical protein
MWTILLLMQVKKLNKAAPKKKGAERSAPFALILKNTSLMHWQKCHARRILSAIQVFNWLINLWIPAQNLCGNDSSK